MVNWEFICVAVAAAERVNNRSKNSNLLLDFRFCVFINYNNLIII